MITVREMEIDDLEQVTAIEEQNFSRPWTETGFFSFLLRNDTLFLVAEEEEKILGYIGVILVLDEGDITNVSVEPSQQGRGIGTLLLEKLITRTEREGIAVLHLEVRKSNTRAAALYERMGFVTDGLRKNYYEAPTEDGVLMSRTAKRN